MATLTLQSAQWKQLRIQARGNQYYIVNMGIVSRILRIFSYKCFKKRKAREKLTKDMDKKSAEEKIQIANEHF